LLSAVKNVFHPRVGWWDDIYRAWCPFWEPPRFIDSFRSGSIQKQAQLSTNLSTIDRPILENLLWVFQIA